MTPPVMPSSRPIGTHDIVDRALDGFRELIPPTGSTCSMFPGALRRCHLLRPRSWRLLGAMQRSRQPPSSSMAGSTRTILLPHAVVDGLMRAGLDTGVPVLSVSLDPAPLTGVPRTPQAKLS